MDKARILIVEDECVIREYIKELIEDLGYGIFACVSSGEKAIERCTKERPNLIIMDIKIKGKLDGIETAQILHDKYKIPVLYLTSYADKNTLERAKYSKPYGYLVKPINKQDLYANIEISLFKAHEESLLHTELVSNLENTHKKLGELTKQLKTNPHTKTTRESLFFTIKDVAEYLGVNRKTIQRMIKEGIFPESLSPNTGSKKRYWHQKTLDEFKPSLREKGRPKKCHQNVPLK